MIMANKCTLSTSICSLEPFFWSPVVFLLSIPMGVHAQLFFLNKGQSYNYFTVSNPTFYFLNSCGLYYKNLMIVNDNHNDATIWSIILQLSITLLESSIMLPKDIYSTGITHNDHHMTIIICLQYRPLNQDGLAAMHFYCSHFIRQRSINHFSNNNGKVIFCQKSPSQ